MDKEILVATLPNPEPMIKKDARLKLILKQIGNFRQGHLNGKQRPRSAKGDELDQIISDLNALGNELKERRKKERDDAARVNALMNVLLKFTVMDFSARVPISKAGDEIDAVALGLNTLSEEYEYLLNKLKDSEAKLKMKAEELSRSNTELEQFASVASHDLQEPLRMVSSYVQLLEKKYKDKLDGDAADFIRFAVDGANRMRILIQSLLEYSRVNRVKPKEDVDLNVLIDDVKRDLAVAIEESGARFKYNRLPVVWGDSVLLGQLFLNLFGNAIKFRSKSPPEIKINVKKVNQEYLFCVKDNGIGIKKAHSEKVFVIFQRLHPKDKYPGTGIGLAICKKIVERHEGRIWVESDENKGASFYFTISAHKTK